MYQRVIKFWVVLLIATAACNQSTPSTTPYNWQTILSRDEGDPAQRFALYRAKVPVSWTRHDPSAQSSNADTMKSICDFTIQDGDQSIRVSIHNFPSNQMEERIPPSAQLGRWRLQFDHIVSTDCTETPIARGGFKGLLLSATGWIQDSQQTLLAWSMQMAPEQYLQLQEQNFLQRQRRSDYTIKATGSPLVMRTHEPDLLLFANSFELIEEIPRR